MTGRTKHTEGFTLAEVMLAVAIILVLGAIAFPSIVTTQNNMRILELSSAAESIANAAQTQMTAKKADGTWLPLVETATDEGTATPNFPAASNTPLPAGANPADTFLMTAAQARQNGILPAGSVDETVRAGDYVIELTSSTATVVSVFYADGKTGFFDDAPASGTAALDYYQARGARDIASRLAANPMIGYYEGTPSSATPAVALANPVVWVDDQTGRLCVQNPNLFAAATPHSTTAIAIMKRSDPSVGFALTGFDELASTYTVQPLGEDQEGNGRPYFNIGDTKLYELAPKTPTATVQDVFALDLNELSRIVQADQKAQEMGLAALVAQFAPDEEILAEAVVTHPSSIPAAARAHIQWPGKVARLALYLTDPSPDSPTRDGRATAEHIKGTYTAPLAELVTTSGGKPVTGIGLHLEAMTFDIGTPDALKSENVESSRQAYSGGWVALSEAYDQQANVKATVGSYTPEGSGQAHDYRMSEMWANGQRVGFLKQDAWTWEATDLANGFRACIQGLDEGTVTEELTTITIDTRQLADTVTKNADGGFDVYIRTAPKASEVENYFTAHAAEIALQLAGSGSPGITNARDAGRGAAVRQPFENEFGAPSTVATWTVATREGALATATGKFPAAGDMRVYYSATPAVAWSPDGAFSGASAYTALPNCTLWLYDQQKDGSFAAQPAALARDSRAGEADNLSLAQSDSAGFEIPDTRDHLFYRLLEYCNQDGAPLRGYDLQYVPYTVMHDRNHAAIAREPEVEGKLLVGWLIEGGTGAWPETESYLFDPNRFGTPVGDYDDSLAYGYVRLKAQYKDKPKPAPAGVGLIYVEFDETGGVSGYQGYYTTPPENPWDQEKSRELRSLPTGLDASPVASWDYRVIVPAGAGKPFDVNDSSRTWVTLSETPAPITIAGATYDSYSLVDIQTWQAGMTFDRWRSKAVIPLSVITEDVGGMFQCNLLSAAAVSLSSQEAGRWGTAASPWTVRAADQVIGYRGIDEAVAAATTHDYSKDNYRQDIDINMSAATRTSDITFAGTFDGQGYRIKDYQPQLDLEEGETAGLFVKANSAQFSNVHLAVQSSQIDVPKKSGELRLGLLVGKAEQSTFSGCTVEGAGGTQQAVTIGYQGKLEELAIGLLVGKAETSTFADCAASNLVVAADVNADQRCFGGLIGIAEEEGGAVCSIANTSVGALVSNVEFIVSKAFGKGESAGCLVGEGASGVDISGLAAPYGSNVFLTTNGAPQPLDDIPIGDAGAPGPA